MKTRYIPTDAKAKNYHEGKAVVYIVAKRESLLHALAYSGKRSKPDFNYLFESKEQLESCINRWLERLQTAENNRQERAQVRKNYVNTFKVGDILSASWGYDQTNVNFYEVIEVKGRAIIIREISSMLCEERATSMAGYVMPARGHYIGEPIKKMVNGGGVKINSSIHASKWDGEPEYKSWYA